MTSSEDLQRLSGMRAIIVEDSFVVAHSLEWLLTSHGCSLAGKAASVTTARELAATAEYDVAVLDIRLGDDVVADVARVVHDRGKRIVYLTGYMDAGLVPPDLRSYPILSKPVRSEELIDALLGR